MSFEFLVPSYAQLETRNSELEMEHITPLITDYVLDLLPGDERVRVEQHAAACPSCRQRLQAERHLVHLTRDTLSLTLNPLPTRLAAYRPPIPARSRPWYTTQTWQRSLAVMTVFLFLLITSFTLFPNGSTANALPTHIAITATATTAPATATHTLVPPTETSLPEAVPSLVGPAVQATPIAFLMVEP